MHRPACHSSHAHHRRHPYHKPSRPQFTHPEYIQKLTAEIDRVSHQLAALAAESSQPHTDTGSTDSASVLILPATATEIMALEMPPDGGVKGSVAADVGIIFDWKVEHLTCRVLDRLVETNKVLPVILRAGTDGRTSYGLGKTRPDYAGLMRIFTITTNVGGRMDGGDGGTDGPGSSKGGGTSSTTRGRHTPAEDDHMPQLERYRDMLRLLVYQAESAITDKADSAMGFFEIEFKPWMVAAGLAEHDKECVLLGN